jgi:hypothetical protein
MIIVIIALGFLIGLLIAGKKYLKHQIQLAGVIVTLLNCIYLYSKSIIILELFSLCAGIMFGFIAQKKVRKK